MTLAGVVSAILIANTAIAQAPSFGFAAAVGDTGADVANAATADTCGNVYVAGTFQGTVDLDPGPGIYSLTSTGAEDIFVAKWSPQGTLLWAISTGGNIGDTAQDIALDEAAGNVYVTGRFAKTADFDPGPGTFNLTADGANGDAYVWKLDTDGNFLWAGAMGGNLTEGFGIALDGVGGVYTTGYFFTTADFDPGPGVYTLTATSVADIFVCKLSTDGAFQWASGFVGTGSNRGVDVVADSTGNAYVTGFFYDTLDADPGPGTFDLVSAGNVDAFVAKLGPTGALVWAGSMGGIPAQTGQGIVLDDAGNVFVAGTFSGLTDFDPGAGTYLLNSTTLYFDGFLCKFDNDGAFQWVQPIGGPLSDESRDVKMDAAGNFYLTGTFRDTVDFDRGPGTFQLTAVGPDDVYLLKLDSGGNFLWAAAAGGTGDDEGQAIALVTEDIVYGVGSFEATVDFDPGAGASNFSSAGGTDGFAMKLEVQAPPVAHDDFGETDADTAVASLSTPAASTLLANDCEPNTFDVLTVTTFDTLSALGAAVTVNADGTFVYDPTGVAVLQGLGAADSVDDSFSYTITDGTDTALGTVTITVFGKGGLGLPASGTWGLGALVLALGLLGALRYTGVRRRC